MNRAGRVVILLLSGDLAQQDLSVPMWRVLAMLNQHGEQELIDPAVMTSVDVSTLSRIFSDTHKRKLFDRRVTEARRREVVISMQAPGNKLINWAIHIVVDCESDITSDIPGHPP